MSRRSSLDQSAKGVDSAGNGSEDHPKSVGTGFGRHELKLGTHAFKVAAKVSEKPLIEGVDHTVGGRGVRNSDVTSNTCAQYSTKTSKTDGGPQVTHVHDIDLPTKARYLLVNIGGKEEARVGLDCLASRPDTKLLIPFSRTLCYNRL
jgi:hypothetical protein